MQSLTLRSIGRSALTVLVLGSGCLLAPRTARAQDAGAPVVVGRGRIDGRVRDSVHAKPLSGAVVIAIGPGPAQGFHSAMSGEDGRFHLDSLPDGRYRVSFTHPFLDSLDLVLPDREVVLTDGGRQELELAVPSAETFRAAACPGLQLDAGTGAVVGTVLDPGTERVVAGATVVVGWRELSVDKSTLHASTLPRTGAVVSDSLGHYRLCGVPTDVQLQLQVQSGGFSGSVIDALVRDSIGLLRQNLSIGTEPMSAARADTSAVAGGVRRPASSGSAVVNGVVRGAQGLPLPDVELRIAGVHQNARSDSLGRFSLGGLPAGTQMLEARRIGYSSIRVPVELRDGTPAVQDVQLVRVVSLDSIRIVAQRSRYREFETHRRNAFGKFLDEQDILRRNPFETSDLLRSTSGFRVIRRGFDEIIVSSRGGGGFRTRECPTNIVVNGMQHVEIDMIHPSEIGAMEIYPGRAGAPIEYDAACGLIVIWTKR
jgi:hypothetical protein